LLAVMLVIPAGGAVVLGAATAPVHSSAAIEPLTLVAMTVAPLRYAPTWLPPGIVETSREADARGERVRRAWHRPGATPGGPGPENGSVVMEVFDVDFPFPTDVGCWGAVSVDINGVRGNMSRDNSTACVKWPAEPRTTLVVTEYGLGLSQEDLLRIARSVRPDAAVLTVPFRIDRAGLLATTAPVGAVMRGDTATGWSVGASFPVDDPDDWLPQAWVTLTSTATPPPGGGPPQPLTVGGRPARYVVKPSKGAYVDAGEAWLGVDVGSGVTLVVSIVFYSGVPASSAELASVVTGWTIGWPDLSWVGSLPA
jgi:hypothetical protein